MPHLTAGKARMIMDDGFVKGKPLTKKQKGLFGAVTGGTSRLVKGLKKKRKK